METMAQNLLEKEFRLLDLLPIAAFVIDCDHNIVHWNRRLEEWSQIPRSSTIGKKFSLYAPMFKNKQYVKRIEGVFRNGLPIVFSSQLNKHIIPIIHKDDEYCVQHTIVTPMPGPDSTYFALFTVQDVTDLSHRIRGYKEMRDRALREVEERKRVEDKLMQAVKTAEKMAEKMKIISSIDGLTGISNRRFFDETYEREWNRAKREKQPISLILLDIDFFKLYNDNYGHLAGDECLRQVALTITGFVKRPTDFFARFGGEEFVIILPNTKSKGAVKLAKSLRLGLENREIIHAYSSASDFVTASFGVSTTVPDNGMDPEHLIKFADEALYNAKKDGRNRVIVKNLPPGQAS